MSSRTVILTESQMREYLIFEANVCMIQESLRDIHSLDDLKREIKKLIRNGASVAAILIVLSGLKIVNHYNKAEVERYVQQVEAEVEQEEAVPEEKWKLAADDVLATVYNAVP